MPKRILVIDDETYNCDLLKEFFGDAGFAVDTASDVPAGVQAACAGRPDLVLLDMMLPGGGGEEVVRQLAANPQTKAIPIFLTTSLTSREASDKIPVGEQCLGYFQKPFQLKLMLERVERVLGVKGPPAKSG